VVPCTGKICRQVLTFQGDLCASSTFPTYGNNNLVGDRESWCRWKKIFLSCFQEVSYDCDVSATIFSTINRKVGSARDMIIVATLNMYTVYAFRSTYAKDGWMAVWMTHGKKAGWASLLLNHYWTPFGGTPHMYSKVAIDKYFVRLVYVLWNG